MSVANLLSVILCTLGMGHETDSLPNGTLDTLRVTDHREQPRGEIDIEQQEHLLGLQDDLNNVLFMQPGVSRVPESGSSLLIRGGGTYDNRYLVYGVPVFPPSHFAQHSYAERAGPLFATVDRMELSIDGVSGRYWGAPAAVISMEPGMARPADPRLVKRPEIVLNYGTLAFDLSASTPLFKGASFYQISWRNANDYLLDAMDLSNLFVSYGNGLTPRSYGDIIVAGENRLANVRLRQHIWYAYDTYSQSPFVQSGKVPWGVGALTADGEGRNGDWDVRVGGSRQHWYEGHRYGPVEPIKHVARTNAILSWDWRRHAHQRLGWSIGTQAEYLNWRDTLAAIWESESLDSVVRSTESGDELRTQAQASVRLRTAHSQLGFDLLAGAVWPYAAWYVDPGLWARRTGNALSLEATAGMHSSLPDIRGMPDHDYRGTVSRTYETTAGLRWSRTERRSLRVDAFLKYRDRCPRFGDDPAAPRWDPAEQTSMLAYGADLLLDWRPREWFLARGVAGLWRTARYDHGERLTHEHDIPWTAKAILRLGRPEGVHVLHLTGVFGAGPLSRDLALDHNRRPVFTDEWLRVPEYKRIDIKYEVTERPDDLRFVTMLGAYLELVNIVGFVTGLFSSSGYPAWENAREYWWNVGPDGELYRIPVCVTRYMVNIGLRAGFRL